MNCKICGISTMMNKNGLYSFLCGSSTCKDDLYRTLFTEIVDLRGQLEGLRREISGVPVSEGLTQEIGIKGELIKKS